MMEEIIIHLFTLFDEMKAKLPVKQYRHNQK